MANESATLTVTLVDEMSAGLESIAQKFEDIRKATGQLSEQSQETFRRTHRGTQEAAQGASRLGNALREVGGLARGALTEFNQQLLATQRGLSGVDKGVLATTQGLTSMAGALRGVAGGFAGLVGGAAAVAGGIYLVARSFVNASVEAQNLRMRLGETNDFWIKSAQRLGQQVGESHEQTIARMRRFSDSYFETVKGTSSSLFEQLSKFGPEGEKLFTRLQQAMQRGMGSEQAFQQIFLPAFAREPEIVQRRLATVLGYTREYLVQQAKLAKDNPPPWVPSEEQQKAMRDQENRLRTHFNNVSNILSDNVSQAWYPYRQKILAGLGDIFKYLDQELPGALDKLGTKWKETFGVDFNPFQAAVREMRAILGDVSKFLDEIKRIRDWWNKTPEQRIKEHEEERNKSRTGPQPGNPVWDWLNRIGGRMPEDQLRQQGLDALRKGMAPQGAPQQFGDFPIIFKPKGERTAPGDPSFGPLSGNIEDRREEQGNVGESTEYLREIRDVMVWLRDQTEAGGGGGGAGAGGGAVGFFGAGGAGAGGAGWGAGGGVLGGGGAGAGGGVIGGGGGGAGGAGRGGGPADTTQAGGFRAPTSPGEAPETLEAAGLAAGAGGDIAAERARVMKQLAEPATRSLASWMISHEQGGREGRTDVLESLVNRAVVTGKHPMELLTSGFYGPINRYRQAHGGQLPSGADWATKDLDAAAAQVGAGRNVLQGRTDQGMINEVRRQGRLQSRGEYYGWMGLRGEQQTAAARGAAGGGGARGISLGDVRGAVYGQGEVAAGELPRFRTERNAEVEKYVGFENAVNRLDPEFRTRVSAAYQAMPDDVKRSFVMNEGWRSYEYQAHLHATRSGRGMVARPGHSRHERGEAIDVDEGPARDWLRQHGGRFGIEPLRGDAPHFQKQRDFRGTLPAIAARAQDGRASVDRPFGTAAGHSLGKGQIDINVKAPRGTKVGSSGDGVFEDMKLTKTPQMAPSGAAENNQYAEE